MILKKELEAAPISDPTLHWHNLHEVISQGDCKDWHCRYIEHRVELTNWSDYGDGLEVFIEKRVNPTWEVSSANLRIALVGKSAECHEC